MRNICPTNPRSNEATMTAPTTTAVSSFRKATTCWPKVSDLCSGGAAARRGAGRDSSRSATSLDAT